MRSSIERKVDTATSTDNNSNISSQYFYEEQIRTELTKMYGWGQLIHRNGHRLPSRCLLYGQESIREASDKLSKLLGQWQYLTCQGGNGHKPDTKPPETSL